MASKENNVLKAPDPTSHSVVRPHNTSNHIHHRRSHENQNKRRLSAYSKISFFCVIGVAVFFITLSLDWKTNIKEEQNTILSNQPRTQNIPNPDLASDLVESLLCASDQSQAESLCRPSLHFSKIYAIFEKETKNKQISVKNVKLRNSSEKTYIEVSTDNSSFPCFIVYVENDKHLIDLPSSIGYNEISIDQLNTLEIQEATNVRCTLYESSLIDSSNLVEAKLPNDPGRLHLSFAPNSSVKHQLEKLLPEGATLKAIVSLHLNDDASPPCYLLQNITHTSWFSPE